MPRFKTFAAALLAGGALPLPRPLPKAPAVGPSAL